MFPIDPQGSHTRGIIDGRMLESADPFPVRGFKFQKLYINLDVMAGPLLFVTMGLSRAFLDNFRQTVRPMTNQNQMEDILIP